MLRSTFFLSALTAASLVALPSGHKVSHGKVKVTNRGNETVITSGKSAVIRWDKFSVGRDETLHFKMADAKSSVLNRVTGGDKSEILGKMDSNGKVYLLNPKGVLFGKDCQINVGGLVASTLDVLDADYLKGGNLLFDGDSNASIVNLGKISSSGGDVYLLAQKVENQGSIEARCAGLGAGSQILLKPKGNERIFVRAGSAGNSADNPGEIKALVTELKTKSAYEMAVNCSGNIQATKTKRVKGRIYLTSDQVSVGGNLTADGGKIVVKGRDITLEESSVLDVSSERQAGLIQVGPKFSADTIDVKEGAQLLANGRAGGKVYLLSQEDAYFRGHISARGWDDFDGGFAEVSSQNVWQKGTVDFRSDEGKFGSILFDPGPITISPGSGPFGPNAFFTTEINAALLVGNVTIATSAPGVETITFTGGVSVIAWTADTTFALRAGESISAMAGSSATVTNTAVLGGVTAINFEANQAATTTGPFIGIDLSSISLTTDLNDIVLDGTGGDSGSTNTGVLTGAITTTTGDTSITGASVGDAAGSDNSGVVVGGTIFTVTGTVTINGTGGDGVATNYGVQLADGSGITSPTRTISITGQAGGSGTGTANHGVIIGASTVSGPVTIIGTGGSGTDTNHGINFASAAGSITSFGFPINLTGIGGAGSGMGNVGISQAVAAEVFSSDFGGLGQITYVGTGGSGTGDSTGVEITGASATPIVHTNGAVIRITGIAGTASGSDNRGVYIQDNSIRTGITDGGVTITGIGGSSGTTSDNHGILITSTGTGTGVLTQGVGDDIVLVGVGGSGSGTDNNGITLSGGATLFGLKSEVGLNGFATGGSDDNRGVLITGAGTTVSGEQFVGIDGTVGDAVTGTGNDGVHISSSADVIGLSDSSIQIVGTGGNGTSLNRGVNINGSVSIISSPNVSGGGTLIDGTGGNGTIDNEGIFVSDSTITQTSGSLTMTGRAGTTDANGITLVDSTITVSGRTDVNGLPTGSGVAVAVMSTVSAEELFITGAAVSPSASSSAGVHISTVNGIVTGSTQVTITGTGGGNLFSNPGILIDDSGVVTGTGTANVNLLGTGGTGTFDCPGVHIAHPSVVSVESGTLTIDGTGGTSSGADSHGVLIDGAASSGTPEVLSTSGTINVIGREGNTNNQGLKITSEGAIGTTSGPINVTTLSDMVIDSGGQILGGAGLLTIDVDRDFLITGDAPDTGVFPGTGGVSVSAGRDLTLTGTATGAAQIGSVDPAGITSNIVIAKVGRNLLVDGGSLSGAATSGYAVIGHGQNFAATYSGTIVMTGTVRNVTIRGANSGAGSNGFGQIGHLALAAGAILNGNINILSRSDINVTGGTGGATSYARVAHGGPSGVVFTTTQSRMSLIANRNLVMTSQAGAGQAIVTNPSSVLSQGQLTLVVDNLFATFPEFGPGGLNLGAGSDLSTVIGRLRLYTVQPCQNSINELINGVVYVPTAFNVNNPTNEYNTYFPGGSFVMGSAFRMHYKVGVDILDALLTIFCSNRFCGLQIAEAELQDRLPLFRHMRLPAASGNPWHHPSICGSREACDPGFDPYHSFIFEDDVDWVGERSSEVL